MRSMIVGLLLASGPLTVGCDDTPEPGFIGVSYTYVTPADVKRLGLKSKSGTRITKLAPGGPGDDAGLKVDDVIFAFHGKKIQGPKQFADAIAEARADQEFAVAVYREGKVVELKVETVPKPN